MAQATLAWLPCGAKRPTKRKLHPPRQMLARLRSSDALQMPMMLCAMLHRFANPACSTSCLF